MIFAYELWLVIAEFLNTVDARSVARPVYNEALDNGTYGAYPVRTYMTEDVSSPRINFVEWSPECDDGLSYFITPRGQSLKKPAPIILDGEGELVWTQFFENPFGGQAYDFQVQRYEGEDYLTFWLGDDSVRGHGAGVYYMLNSSYDIVREIKASNGLSADLHEFVITPEGTALMTIYEPVWHNLTGYREFNVTNDPDDAFPNYVWDCLIQEISIDSGEVLFQWRTTDHVNISDTFHAIDGAGTQEVPWDWFHINSIFKDELGNYLTSARYTHTITYVDGKTGDVLWTLGGKRNNFMDLSNGTVLNFAWQHDARFHSVHDFPEIYSPRAEEPGMTTRLLTLFDNAAADLHYEYGAEQSRGLLLEVTFPTSRAGVAADRLTNSTWGKLDREEHLDEQKLFFINGTDPEFTVRLIKSYDNPHGVRSSSQGSLQVLSGQDRTKMFVGYGNNAVWTEFDINGTALCDVHFSAAWTWEQNMVQSYRAFKFPWKGYPKWSPKIEISDDDLEIYLSWNGATEVAQWVLQGSDSDDESINGQWEHVAAVPRSGFETSIELPDVDWRFLRAMALDKHGQALEYGLTDIIDRETSPSLLDELNSHLQKQIIQENPIRSYVLLFLGVVMAIVAYDLIRRVYGWTIGKPSVGRFRWKKGMRYTSLRSEV